jgi:hypothetical protein
MRASRFNWKLTVVKNGRNRRIALLTAGADTEAEPASCRHHPQTAQAGHLFPTEMTGSAPGEGHGQGKSRQPADGANAINCPLHRDRCVAGEKPLDHTL